MGRTLVPEDIQHTTFCIQPKKLSEKRAPAVFHHKEGISEELRKHGELIQIQVSLLWAANCFLTSSDDSFSNRLHGEGSMIVDSTMCSLLLNIALNNTYINRFFLNTYNQSLQLYNVLDL